jgi:hypothetical protein
LTESQERTEEQNNRYSAQSCVAFTCRWTAVTRARLQISAGASKQAQLSIRQITINPATLRD